MTMLDPHLDVDQLSAAVDGERDAAVAAHLLHCATCREQVETWKRSLGQLRALDTGPSPEAKPAADRALAKAMAELPRTAKRDRRRMSFMSIAASVAAVFLVAAVVVGIVEAGGGGGGSASSGGASSGGAASIGAPSHGAGSAGGGESASGAGGSGQRSTAGKAATSGGTAASGTLAPLAAGDKSILTSELRRLVKSHGPSRVPARTPCDHKAKRLAAARVTGPTPATLTVPVTYQGLRGRVFVFSHGRRYVAFVLRSTSCDLLTTVAF